MLDPITWIAIGLGLMGLEVLVPGFVIFWFGAGALVVSLLTAIGMVSDLTWQWGVFFIASLAFIGFWHFVLRERFGRKAVDDRRDPTVTGQRGTVTRAIGPRTLGEVELSLPLYGIRRWQAMADHEIPTGTLVEVIEAEGVRLHVRRTSDT